MKNLFRGKTLIKTRRLKERRNKKNNTGVGGRGRKRNISERAKTCRKMTKEETENKSEKQNMTLELKILKGERNYVITIIILTL